MSDAQPLADLDRLGLDGLDTVFEDSVEEQSHTTDGAFLALSVSQASVMLGIEEQAVIRLLKKGKLCGKKDARGRTWQVDAHCLRAQLETSDKSAQDSIEHIVEDAVQELVVRDYQEVEADGFHTLLEKLEHAHHQLHASNFMIGYLQSQLENQAQTLKLLPDLQAQSAKAAESQREAADLRAQLQKAQEELVKMQRPWWSKLTAWVGGNP